MGQSTNSIGFRLGWKTRWRARTYNRFNNSFSLFNYNEFFQLLTIFFKKKVFSKSLGFIFSHFEYYQVSNTFYFTIFLYPSNLFLTPQPTLRNQLKRTAVLDYKVLRNLQIYISKTVQVRLLTLGIRSFVNVEFISFTKPTASVISRRVLNLLGSKRLPLPKLPNLILSLLYKPLCRYKLSGFLIKCSGRFSRRQIATSDSYRFGSVPFSTISQPIDYSFSTLRLRNGTCSIKIWSCPQKI